MVAACPYCGVILDPPPPRSRKCPECGEKIVIRTDRETGEKLYLTSEAVARFDADRAAASARKKAMRRVEAMGLTSADFDAKSIELAEEWGHAPGPGDVYWSLANEQALLLQILQRNDPTAHGMELQQIYWEMARQLHEEGRSYRRTMQQAHNARLIWEQARLEDVVGSEVAEWRTKILADACCDVCKTLDGHSYTFEKAMEEMPLPPEDCTRGWCNCGWLNVPPPI